jgi:hypothetical protein
MEHSRLPNFVNEDWSDWSTFYVGGARYLLFGRPRGVMGCVGLGTGFGMDLKMTQASGSLRRFQVTFRGI